MKKRKNTRLKVHYNISIVEGIDRPLAICLNRVAQRFTRDKERVSCGTCLNTMKRESNES